MKKAIILGILILLGIAHASAAELGSVTPEEVEKIIKNPEASVVIVDCRSPEAYAKGHIPGAINLYWKSFRGKSGQLISVDGAAKILGENGITNDKDLILYDDRGGSEASYVFWMLDYFGHNGKVRIFDGSVSKVWKGEWSTKEIKLSPASYEVNLKPEVYADTEWVEKHLNDPNVIFLDARSPDEYLGKKITDLRGGHLPGAINLNYEELWVDKETKRLKSADELESLFAGKGLDKDKEIVIYCHTGRRASFVYFALELMGYEKIRTYDESMIFYANKPHLPLENENFLKLITLTKGLDAVKKDVGAIKAGIEGLKGIEERVIKATWMADGLSIVAIVLSLTAIAVARRR